MENNLIVNKDVDNKNIEADLTPKKIVYELDTYIIGQTDAKRSVSVAIRNRYRRKLLADDLRDEVSPKNIILIGPTGIGKTEIARRLAKLVHAPFIKVEATKYTEVGYVGRDVESMVRDLVNIAVMDARLLKMKEVEAEALDLAIDKLVDLIMPSIKKNKENTDADSNTEIIIDEDEQKQENKKIAARNQMKIRIKNGDFDDVYVDIKIKLNQAGMTDMMPGMGFEDNEMFQNVIGSIMPQKKKTKKLRVIDAKKHLVAEISDTLIDMDKVTSSALDITESMGIIFLDEIDKIVSGDKSSSTADVARHGVQRDLLPIVEGTTVNTRYGPVRTDHILFIAAGAFHVNKPSDLIPELQGRFPIRVELKPLLKADFKEILTKPKNALTKQYIELLKTEGVGISFTDGALDYIAEIAYTVNTNVENIGARRLHTIMEKIFEEISFSADECSGQKIEINEEYVKDKLKDIVKNVDVSRYIL